MNNVLIYINPAKKFSDESAILARIQIDNSLDLGWKDIQIFTNFPYRYNGVQAIEIGDENYCEFRPLSTKTVTVANLGLTGWIHDFDAYQLNPMEPQVGFTDYGWSKKVCLGSYFIDDSLKDTMIQLKDRIYRDKVEDERALMSLHLDLPKLNIAYNFGMRHVKENWEIAEKPLKVLHFHPWYPGDVRTMKVFMHGKNKLGFPLMNERLTKIFQYHGLK